MARLFEGWGYVVVAEVAAALGLMVALVTVRLPVAILVAAVPLVGLVLGGPVSQVSQGLGAGLLDPGTITDVLQGTWTSWGELLTTLPWVDLEGAPAPVPFLIGYLGAVLAGALALRTRSAGGSDPPAARGPCDRAADATWGRNRQRCARLVPRDVRRCGDRLAGAEESADRAGSKRLGVPATDGWCVRSWPSSSWPRRCSWPCLSLCR